METDKLFVRGVWRLIPSDDESWVIEASKEPLADSPCGDKGVLIKQFLDAGISAEDIARFSRIVGYEVAFSFCCHLDDPSAYNEEGPDTTLDREWALVETKDEEIVDVIPCVYESLLLEDPSGREMRPKRNT